MIYFTQIIAQHTAQDNVTFLAGHDGRTFMRMAGQTQFLTGHFFMFLKIN